MVMPQSGEDERPRDVWTRQERLSRRKSSQLETAGIQDDLLAVLQDMGVTMEPVKAAATNGRPPGQKRMLSAESTERSRKLLKSPAHEDITQGPRVSADSLKVYLAEARQILDALRPEAPHLHPKLALCFSHHRFKCELLVNGLRCKLFGVVVLV